MNGFDTQIQSDEYASQHEAELEYQRSLEAEAEGDEPLVYDDFIGYEYQDFDG
jgi:hypothetical protein